MNQTADGGRPILKARIAGVLYLLIIAGGLFAEAFVRQQIIIYGDPAATAQNILDNEMLFRLGFVVNLSYLLCNIPFATLLFDLFKGVNRSVARMAMLLVVVTTSVEAANVLNHLSALEILQSVSSGMLGAAQRHADSYAALEAFSAGFGACLVFFGLVCLMYGWLILRSGLVPRVIGLLMVVAGLCYLTNSYAMFLAPDLSSRLFPLILIPSFIAELSFAIWLTVMGVSRKRWAQWNSVAPAG